MIEYFIDANALLRYLLEDIPEQTKRTQGLLTEAKKGTVSIEVPLLVVAEVYFVLYSFYKLPIDEICKQLEAFCKLAYIDIEHRLLVQQIFSSKAIKRIGFLDTYLLLRSIHEERRLFTFDKKLARLAKTS
ncbi:PIN domain-containing protein [Candidatus Gottesmanbacteria bacterium]|nr:PIN domain-containing protein [Candidatus Gottesmanbacteria bacterium]